MTVAGLLHLDQVPPKIARQIKKGLSLDNPLYYRLLRMGNTRALYKCPQHFHYYEENKQTGRLSVGRGLQEKIVEYAKQANERLLIEDRTVKSVISRDNFPSIKLRDYQEGIPEEIIKHNYGIIKLNTGFGKTVIALEVARLLAQKTLFIVPRRQLATQFKEAVSTFLECEAGRIEGNVMDLTDFTVVTWETLAKRVDKYPLIADTFGSVFVDECDRAVSPRRRGTLAKLKPKYLYGLTATPRRTDKQDKAIEFTFGPIIIDRNQESQETEVEVVSYRDNFASFEYHEIANHIATDKIRHKVIAEYIQKAVAKGGKVLVLTKRIEHYQQIYECKRPDDKWKCLDSKSSITIPDPEETDVILGTFSLLSTGVDIPWLDTLIIAGDLKSDVLTEQSIGRIKRIFRGKDNTKVIDIADAGNPILYNQFKTRLKFYNQSNWKVIYV